MQQQNELLDAIEVIVNKAIDDKGTRVTGGKVKSASSGTAVVAVNGVDYSFPYTGTAPTVGSTCRVFIPNGNMSDAFIGAGGGGGGSGTSNYNSLTNKPQINGVTLSGNKASADLGLYGTNNAPPYPVTSVNGKTGDVIIEGGGGTGAVESVNGKTGAVVLTASDVGALPDTTDIPTVNDAILTVQKNGTSVGTFSANASTNKSINITVPTNNNELTNGSGYITESALTPYAKTDDLPTKTSDLINDSGYITSSGAPVQSVNGKTGAVVLSATDVGALSSDTTIPTVNDGTLTIQRNGTTVKTFTANSSTDVTANIEVPTNTNQLTNGAGYITAEQAPVTSVNGKTGDVVVEATLPDNVVIYAPLGEIEATQLINADTLGGHNADYFATATSLNNKLDKSGGTMTGALTLSGAPTANLQAATKKYVDDSIQSAISDTWEASY